MSTDYSRYVPAFHIALGGAICLFAMYIFLSILPNAVRMLLFNLGLLGLLAFNQVNNAMTLLMIGIVYIPSGFLGGLYTGYKIKENLRVVLLFPGFVALLGLIALRFSTGYLNFSTLDLQQEILLPLLGNIVGTYLGGYTMNWEQEEAAGLSETIDLDMSQVKS